jgi:thiamine biosynthesis lipoprotein
MMRRAQPWLGTLVEIALEAGSAPELATAAFAEIALVHRRMSFHAPDSDVTRFNLARAGDVVEINAHTWTVLQLAARVYDASGGSFDIACAPRLVEWAYLPAPLMPAPAFVPRMPAYELEAAGRVRKTADAWIDLGGIAKGYAVDLAIASLMKGGACSAFVNAGGDMRAIGPLDWPVSIRAPHNPALTGARLALSNEALATSAIYFSAKLTSAGFTVSPLIDGRTGQALTESHSVSVCGPSCAIADALTKVIMASGDTDHPCLEQFGARAFII